MRKRHRPGRQQYLLRDQNQDQGPRL